MLHDLIDPVIIFVGHHHGWAIAMTFLIAFGEALPFVGAAIPGTPLLLGIAAAISTNGTSLLPVTLAAFAGAVASDGLAFWLGHRYGDRLLGHRFFSAQGELIARSERLFRRFGVAAVAIGRFTPLLRAIVPVMAGALHMPIARFYVANVASAALWAPLHVLPGGVASTMLARIKDAHGWTLALVGAAIVIGGAVALHRAIAAASK